MNKKQIPKNVAIIMDGNGRWAKNKNKSRNFGHKNSINAISQSIEAAIELGVKSLVLFAFSSENINRPKKEISALFSLFYQVLKKEVNTLHKNNIKLKFIGDLSIFDAQSQRLMQGSVEKLQNNEALELVIALNYGGKTDIINACNSATKPLTIAKLTKNLAFNKDIDLLIRTSGEMRISNFLLWQCAYSELYFTDVLWPDFNKKDFYKAVETFGKRERRFGKI